MSIDLKDILRDIDKKDNVKTLMNIILTHYKSGNIVELEKMLEVVRNEVTYTLSDVEVFPDKEIEYLDKALKLLTIYLTILALIIKIRNITILSNVESLENYVLECNLSETVNLSMHLVQNYINGNHEILRKISEKISKIDIKMGVKPFEKCSWIMKRIINNLIDLLTQL